MLSLREFRWGAADPRTDLGRPAAVKMDAEMQNCVGKWILKNTEKHKMDPNICQNVARMNSNSGPLKRFPESGRKNKRWPGAANTPATGSQMESSLEPCIEILGAPPPFWCPDGSKNGHHQKYIKHNRNSVRKFEAEILRH